MVVGRGCGGLCLVSQGPLCGCARLVWLGPSQQGVDGITSMSGLLPRDLPMQSRLVTWLGSGDPRSPLRGQGLACPLRTEGAVHTGGSGSCPPAPCLVRTHCCVSSWHRFFLHLFFRGLGLHLWGSSLFQASDASAPVSPVGRGGVEAGGGSHQWVSGRTGGGRGTTCGSPWGPEAAELGGSMRIPGLAGRGAGSEPGVGPHG